MINSAAGHPQPRSAGVARIRPTHDGANIPRPFSRLRSHCSMSRSIGREPRHECLPGGPMARAGRRKAASPSFPVLVPPSAALLVRGCYSRPVLMTPAEANRRLRRVPMLAATHGVPRRPRDRRFGVSTSCIGDAGMCPCRTCSRSPIGDS